MDVDGEDEDEAEAPEGKKQTLLNDPRFTQLFENPEFAVDEASREYALMNPSAVARKMDGSRNSRAKTAVEDEDEESDKVSSDGLGESDSDSESDASDDSSDAGGKFCSPSLRFFLILLSPQNSTHSTRVHVLVKRTNGSNRLTPANASKIAHRVSTWCLSEFIPKRLEGVDNRIKMRRLVSVGHQAPRAAKERPRRMKPSVESVETQMVAWR
jgi:hypothetical protein